MIEPIIFYSLIFGVSLLAVSFAVIAYLLKRNMQKFYKLVEEEVHSKEAHIKGNEYLLKAQNDGEAVIRDAHNKASQIISNANQFNAAQKAHFEEEVRKVASGQAEKYGVVLNDLVKLIRDDTAAELNNFNAKLLQYISQMQQELRQQADKEIDEYKKQWFERIDNSMLEIIQTASKNIIGHQLTMSEQEDYVMKVLDDAKSTHVF